MSKGRNKYKWADGGNDPRHGPATPVERDAHPTPEWPSQVLTGRSGSFTHMSSNTILWRPRTLVQDPMLNDGQVFDLLALGYTAQEIDALQELVCRSLSGGPDRVFYRHQARKRSKPVFGYNRLYKKSHEPGPKRLDGTIVWLRGRGFLWPFPEVGNEH